MDEMTLNFHTLFNLICDVQEQAEAAAREARNAYYREWRKKHPEKQREYMQRYWARRYQRGLEAAMQAGNEQ